ncbi:hypothetical protein, partial [Amycolatopsis sp.]|uniref:hypothetical protein n=1 Tax=Amycolatopsis sp. TaxID=37632 RepID=UPI002D7E79E6
MASGTDFGTEPGPGSRARPSSRDLLICLRANGLAAVVRMLPDPAEPDLVAVIRLDGNQKATAGERKLAEAVFRRHTNRRPFLDKEVPPAARTALKSAALQEGGQIEYLNVSGRYSTVASLVRQAEALQADDPVFRAEAQYWTHREPGSPDGVPKAASGPPPYGPGVVTLRASHENENLPPREYEQEPLLGVLLTATAEGLATSFLSQPFETVRTRESLDRIFTGLGQPHTLLRIGYGSPTRLTDRRPVEDV